jgi:membrane protease YdiL (CAAX protease family)
LAEATDQRPSAPAATRFDLRSRLLALVGTMTIVVAEWLTVNGELDGAAAGHVIAIALLLAIGVAGPSVAVRRLSIALATLPILRLLSIAVPAVLIPTTAWYIEIGLPSLLAVLLAARALDLRPSDLGLRPMPVRDVLAIGAAGAVLGLPAYLIAAPTSPIDQPAPLSVLTFTVIVVVFVAFMEELLLRGLIQAVGTELFARAGILVSTAATGLLYAASLNLRYVLFMTLVALLFGVTVRRFGSLAGAVAAHGGLVIVQLVVLPILLS